MPINSHCSVCNLINNCISNGLPERCYVNQLLDKVAKTQRVVIKAEFAVKCWDQGFGTPQAMPELKQSLAELDSL